MAAHQEHLFEPPPPERAAVAGPVRGIPRPQVVLDFTRLEQTHHEQRELARRLSTEFEVDEEDALQAVLFWRTEEASRRYMQQRWFRHEIEYRSSRPDSK